MTDTIGNDIFYVGYVDWSVRDFHSYETKRGVTYNSYLITDEKTALVDTIKAPFLKILKENILSHTTYDKIDYIIVNHAEPDHGGSLIEIAKLCPNAKIVCSPKGKEIIEGYHDITNINFHVVQDNDTLSLGKNTLKFIHTPMVHWPDSMFTYLLEEKILFSMDAFGQHYSTSSRFDEEVDYCALFEEAKTYYANIVYPFGNQVLKALDKVKDLQIDQIVPAHGVIWKKYISEIVENYKNWAQHKTKPKVVIVYDTMWESTKIVAEEMAKSAAEKDVEVKLLYLRATSLTQVVTEILEASSVAFGSSTLNKGMMPMMGALLTYLKGLGPKNKHVLCFGSYGWGVGATEEINDILKKMNLNIIAESPLKWKWRPTKQVLEEAKELGMLLAKKATE